VHLLDGKYAFAKDVRRKPRSKPVPASAYADLKLKHTPPGPLREWYIDDLLSYDLHLRSGEWNTEPKVKVGELLLPVPDRMRPLFEIKTYTSKRKRKAVLWKVMPLSELAARYVPSQEQEAKMEALWLVLGHGYIDKQTFAMVYAQACGLTETEAVLACATL